jgi:hypothetical protein
MGGQGQEFSPILAVWLILVCYRHHHSVVGILVGIFGTVTFWRKPCFDNLAGTPFLKNLVGTPGGYRLVWATNL